MKKYLLIALIAAITLTIFIYGGKLFSPGSYADAEKYEFSISEADLILKVEKFKKENSEYNVPSQVGIVDGKQNPQDHWHHIYFFYTQENQVIYAWIRASGKQESTLAFVGVNNGMVLGNWKNVNKDFSSSENREQIRKFEDRILNKLK